MVSSCPRNTPTCVCVCVCVRARERERERAGAAGKETEVISCRSSSPCQPQQRPSTRKCRRLMTVDAPARALDEKLSHSITQTPCLFLLTHLPAGCFVCAPSPAAHLWGCTVPPKENATVAGPATRVNERHGRDERHRGGRRW